MTSSAGAIRIRPAAPGDVPFILSLIRELAEFERAPEQAVATPELLHRHLFGEGLGRGPTAECVVGEVDGAPEGIALFFMNFSTWVGRPGLYLEDLYVRPSARGRGLGRALLAHLAAIAVARECRRFEWIVLDWNTHAIELYRSLGAEPLSEWTVFRLSGESLKNLADAAEGARSTGPSPPAADRSHEVS